MASDCYIGYRNQLLTPPLGSSGVTNPGLLASPIVGRKATLSSAASVDFNFASFAGIRMIGVDGLVLGSGTPAITFAFSNLVPGGGELGVSVRTPALTDGYQTQAWVLDNALATAQFCRVTFANCSAVGLCWASPILNPSIGFSVGATRRWNDLSQVTQSALTGAETVSVRPMYRSVGLRFGMVADDEFAAFDDFTRYTGSHGQVLLIPGLADARRNRDLLLGRLSNLADASHIAPLLMEWPFEIRQSL